ncbi:hypothetical protein ACFO4L_14630 [Bacillus daqingensis]|uniref:Uncharacterized protein n=1 Tax=Bacillus daqingensis TaxID=872396 RepID=A0ABV9NWT0_9BACI
MKKKLSLSILTSVFAVGMLAACGGNDANNGLENDPAENNTTPVEDNADVEDNMENDPAENNMEEDPAEENNAMNEEDNMEEDPAEDNMEEDDAMNEEDPAEDNMEENEMEEDAE